MTSKPLAAALTADAVASETFLHRLNTAWHERALKIFMVIVLAHWAEHLVQAFQIYVLGWPIPDSRGVIGLWVPWLFKSELLHYGYALIMLVGIWMLRPGFVGTSRTWWTVSLVIQFWHHIEHALLQVQAIVGMNLLDRPVPTSIAQIWIPRVELHLLYNSLVFIPMMVAMYYHLFPVRAEMEHMRCSCALRPRLNAA